MGKIAKGVNEINFTMLYGNYCYIIIENFPQIFSPRRVPVENQITTLSVVQIAIKLSTCINSTR